MNITSGADIIAVIILIALAIAIIVYLLHWLYRRSSKEIAFVRTKGTVSTFTAGFNYSLSDKWALNVGTSYTPLDVERPAPAGGDDNLWNFRMGISFNTN